MRLHASRARHRAPHHHHHVASTGGGSVAGAIAVGSSGVSRPPRIIDGRCLTPLFLGKGRDVKNSWKGCTPYHRKFLSRVTGHRRRRRPRMNLTSAWRQPDATEFAAAVLSTLYLDLIRGRSEQRLSQKARDDEETRAALVREYGTMLRAVLADGLVHPLEKAMLADYASKHAVSKDEHRSFLVAEGWTDLEFEHGVKDNLKTERVRVCEHERASMSVRA